MTIVAVGKSSFIAGYALREASNEWRGLSHADALKDDSWLSGASCVINFAYDPDGDMDTRLAEMIRGGNSHFIMLSSRLVYGRRDAATALRETEDIHPQGVYAERKGAAEHSLAALLPPERLTILRLSNIFGTETGRSSFFGQMTSSLARDGVIRFDMAPETVRDFMPVEACARALVRIAQAPVAGLFNLGSGLPIPCGDVAAALIEGFGGGRLEAEGRVRDAFWLDMEKTNRIFGIASQSQEKVLTAVKVAGRTLKKTVFL